MSEYVSHMLAKAYAAALKRSPNLRSRYVSLSRTLGGLLPTSLLSVSIQNAGQLDIVVRQMEDERAPRLGEQENTEIDIYAENIEYVFSAQWVSSIYEILRVLRSRELLTPKPMGFDALFRDVELVRVPLNKHEVTGDKKTKATLEFEKRPLTGSTRDVSTYRYDDPKKAYIMPTGVSRNGSLMWEVLDLKSHPMVRWVERRNLSERFIDMWSNTLSVSKE